MLEYFRLKPDSIRNTKIENEGFIDEILSHDPDFDMKKLDLFNKLVESIVWYASIRSEETGIPGKKAPEFDYSEIQIFEIEINRYEGYNDFYNPAVVLGRRIQKPLIILIKYQDKYRIIMNKARENLKNTDFTVLQETIITYWIYPDSPSKTSKEILSGLDINKYDANHLFDLYSKLFDFLQGFERKCLLLDARPFTYLLSNFINIDDNDLEYLTDYIRDHSIGELYKPPESKKYKEKYKPQFERITIPKNLYDYEDIWHILMKHSEIKDFIENKNVSSMTDLMNSIYITLKINYFNNRFIYIDNIGNDYYASLNEKDLTIVELLGFSTGNSVEDEENREIDFASNTEKTASQKLPVTHLEDNSDSDFIKRALDYEKGEGVIQKKNKAIELYIKAMKQGKNIVEHIEFADTLCNLAVDLDHSPDTNKEKMIEQFKKDLESTFNVCTKARVQYNLARFYGKGIILDADPERAFHLYTNAAEQGHDEAQFYLATCYENGKGTAKNMKSAEHWYKIAAEKGHAKAQCNLAHFYEKGTAGTTDTGEAVNWYTKSAEQGYAKAQYYLGQYYEYGENRNYQQAVSLYIKAALQGYSKGQYKLASCYEKGKGIQKNLKGAVHWYKESAEQDHSSAQFKLALCYEDGNGVPENMEEAARWYRKAAEQDHNAAQYKLAFCYENGDGVPENMEEAAFWYRKAAEQGNIEAMFAIAQFYEMGEGGLEKNKELASYWNNKAEQSNNNSV